MNFLKDCISRSIKDLYHIDYSPEISIAPKPELGEYCINIFPLAKTLGKAPDILAKEIAWQLTHDEDVFISTSATGWYVNFYLTDTKWRDIFKTLSLETKPSTEKTIIVDYIGANIGKPLHIAHICTPSIGQTVVNIYRYLGYKVIWDSHFGDWGGIFGKLIYQWKKETSLTLWKRDALSISFLVELYQAFHRDPDEEDEAWARREFQYLAGIWIDMTNPSEFDHHKENVELWKQFTEISITESTKKLELLNVRATYNIGESFYEGLGLPRLNHEDYPDLNYNMQDIIWELITKWIATKNEDGSVGVVFPEETKVPSCILQKKDGTWLYLTSDLAAIKYRLTNGWNPSKIVYSVDVRQQLHLRQAFLIAKQAWPELLEWVELFHISNGFIKLKEGAISTRNGTVIFLDKLIEEGMEKTMKILKEKWRTLSETDIKSITIAAIKYSYLSQDREKDITFDWEKALNFEWNSGPYIQYAFVRARKILTDCVGEVDIWESILSSYDKKLIQSLAGFKKIIDTVATTYKPHHLALYSYELAVNFNAFYVHTPKILEEKNEHIRKFRLSLVQKTADTLQKTFDLLGIDMPSEM
jgi:arginyl-tRNA synthetase